MSSLKNEIVIHCVRCLKPVIIKSLDTLKPDPEGTLLLDMAKKVSKIALCPLCQAKYNYEAELKLKGIKSDYHFIPIAKS